MEKETIEIQKELFDQGKSKLEKYQELIVGRKGFFRVIKYEFIIAIDLPTSFEIPANIFYGFIKLYICS